jgi:hypothetical protein
LGSRTCGLADSIASALQLTTVAALLPAVLPSPRRAATAAVIATIGIAASLAAAAALTASVHDHDDGGSAHPDAGRFAGMGAVVETPYFAAKTPLGPLELRVGLGPARPGFNAIDVVVHDAACRRARLHDVRLSARRGNRVQRFNSARLAPGHFVVGAARFRTPGWWTLRITARAPKARPLSTTVMVPIRR